MKETSKRARPKATKGSTRKRAAAKTPPVDLAPYEEVATPFEAVVRHLIGTKRG
jgi:hypothetical protein